MDLTILALQADSITAPVLPGGSRNAFLAAGVVYLMIVLAGMIAAFLLCDRLRSGSLCWDARLARIRNRPWGWREAGFLALLLGAAQVAVMLLVMLAPHAFSALSRALNAAGLPADWLGYDAPDWTLFLVQILVFHILGLSAIGVMVRRKKDAALGAFGAGRPGLIRQVGTGVLFYLASLPFVLFGAVVCRVVLYLFGVPSDTQGVIEIFIAAPAGVRVALVLSAFVFAPLFEEALFRGIGLPLFTRRFGGGAAIVIVSALFAAMHFHLASFLPLFILAVSFSLAYVYTGSLVVPVVMHALFNGVNLVMVMLIAAGEQ
ncbi:MAG: CPBP family intramembrane metalloprotease [Lentisphaerae bacterium]|nr:CPBP family intramembrane metalloprotease [Lentisphaerota bacterium]